MFDNWNNIDFGDIESWPRSFKIFCAVIVCILILVAFYMLKVKNQIASLEVVERKEVQLKEEFKEKKALAINLEAYREQMIQAEQTFGVLLKQLPDQNEIPDLLVDVTQAGLSRGLQFEQFKPSGEISRGFYTEKPVNIVVNGSYHQLAEFVSDVASLPRIVNVDDFKISRREEGGLRMEAVTKTYYYDEGGADADDAKPAKGS